MREKSQSLLDYPRIKNILMKFQYLQHKKSLYIAWASFRNVDVIRLFSWSTQLRLIHQLLINTELAFKRIIISW